MAGESEKLIADFLARLQRNARVRKWLAIGLLTLFAGWCGYLVYDIMPRQHTLTISGGEILSNRHLLAKILQEEALAHGIALRIKPSFGSYEELELLDQGKLDLAFIQGGLENHYPNVVHVATVFPELVHLIVRPDISDIAGLKDKVVNLGSKQGGTGLIARKLLEFSGLGWGDYVQSNLSTEELIAEHPSQLPDAVFLISSAPSELAEFLVRERGYQVLEIPFPPSLALRMGWAMDTRMLAYTYSVKPAVPRTDIRTVGVNLHLVANKDVDARAIYKLLDTLTSPAMAVRVSSPIAEAQLTVPSGYRLSEGTKKFLNRNDPLFSSRNFDRLKSFLGLLLSVVSFILVVLKWFKGEDEPAAPEVLVAPVTPAAPEAGPQP